MPKAPAHHLDHWTRTHRTALDDLALGCNGHHHLLHRPGWTMTRRPDLTIAVTRPDGTSLTQADLRIGPLVGG